VFGCDWLKIPNSKFQIPNWVEFQISDFKFQIGLGFNLESGIWNLMKVARKFTISGFVQGVGFRFFTQRAAARHQVLGYVRNLKDGRVETYAEGSAETVEAFKQDLTAGPTYAVVEEIEEIVLEPNGLYSSFRIER
jgi:acylphosphatase